MENVWLVSFQKEKGNWCSIFNMVYGKEPSVEEMQYQFDEWLLNLGVKEVKKVDSHFSRDYGMMMFKDCRKDDLIYYIVTWEKKHVF